MNRRNFLKGFAAAIAAASAGLPVLGTPEIDLFAPGQWWEVMIAREAGAIKAWYRTDGDEVWTEADAEIVAEWITLDGPLMVATASCRIATTMPIPDDVVVYVKFMPLDGVISQINYCGGMTSCEALKELDVDHDVGDRRWEPYSRAGMKWSVIDVGSMWPYTTIGPALS